VLAAAVVSKLAAAGESRASLRVFGLRRASVRTATWICILLAESLLAALLVARVPGVPAAAAALMLVFAIALVLALARGRAGAPCGCFGGRSRIGLFAVVRALLLAAAVAIAPTLDGVRPSPQTWLAAGLVLALAGVVALVAAVLALAREVGELRLSVGPQSALSIEGEGPQLGSRLALVDRFERPLMLALAVFSSETCPLCHALDPAVRLVGREPGVSLERFDERADAEVWRELAIPGAPFAVALDGAGIVLAKGTFNTLAQLEGILAAAERRRLEPVDA
jgi:hypothetical protein